MTTAFYVQLIKAREPGTGKVLRTKLLTRPFDTAEAAETFARETITLDKANYEIVERRGTV